VSATTGRGRMPAERFDRLYRASSDPWDYLGSEYERVKYSETLAALGPGPFARGLEVGCSIGAFTEQLAPRCDELVAIDFAPRAVAIARERLAELPNVELICADFPEQVPAGPWDAIVCSEVLYYLDEPTLRQAIVWLRAQLQRGASVLAVSWRGEGSEEPMRGDEAHELLTAELARWHAFDGRRVGYRLDRFDGR